MSALPDDDWLRTLRPQPTTLSAADYDDLPEEVCRAIEIVDGYVVFCEALSPAHQTAARRLANLLEYAAENATAADGGCLTVNNDIDLRLSDVPLLNRRPDVVLYRCLEPEESRLRAEHVLLIIEIVSPGSETVDSVDKLGEYARAGIPHYWIVRLDRTGVSIIERYRLDKASAGYKHLGTFMKDEAAAEVPMVQNPIPILLDWARLEY